MARKRSSKINIESYVNGSPITPGVTYKLGDADTNTAWLLASSSPCLFKLSATAPTDELWSNITPEQFIINGSVAGQVIEIASPNGKYFVVPTNAQDKNASVESAHATIALHPLGFNYDQEYQALPLDGDGPVSEGFYKISNLESGKLYSINVHPDLGGLMETKPNPEFSYALFSVGADDNPKAFLAGGKTTDQLVFVATETSAILSLGSTIEEAGYFVSIRNFSLGSGEGGGSGTGFDPASDQTISGAWSFTKTPNANAGINIPLTAGAPTNTGAVNRLYAAGMAGATNIYTQHVYLNTGAITATGTAFTKILIPGQYAQTNVPANTHSTVIHTFMGPHGQWNYSSFAGFSIPYQLTAAGKITVDIGRGSKTPRQDLSLDSYSIIPGNNLAYNTGEILDITFDNVRDTARNGYVIRVREIYCTESTQIWKVKTTTSFIPASGNEPIPYIVNKIIYQQYEPRSYIAGDYGDTYGALWLLTGGGSIQQLWMIATVRGVTTFETGTGFNRIVSDVPGIADGSVAILVGSAERTNYQPGNVNPVYYALAAIAENAIETEETTDFEDINIPLEQA